MKKKFVADTRTGVTELRDKTTEYLNLIEELEIAVPYQDSKLKKKLLETSLNLTELLDVLDIYH